MFAFNLVIHYITAADYNIIYKNTQIVFITTM